MTRKNRTQDATAEDLPQNRILVLHGPNLNLLGRREPGIYGHTTLANIHEAMESRARADGVLLESFQSNHEGELIDRVQAAATEVHLANIHAREPFRKHSYFSDKAVGVISGLGAQGYQLALEFALSRLRAERG
ncbi:MAG: 3-dehydroquinate dehydratase [Zoogloea sp.]|nr:3-dehydroquinate dehydratase [Zoogloea sp.]